MIIDLRGNGFTYSEGSKPGQTVRLYDLFASGELGTVGDTILWRTPTGTTGGEVVETGWEDRPGPIRWVDVTVTETP